MASSDLHNKDGIEYPTHTTSHNQVVAVTVSDPSSEVMDNYVQLKNERDMSWDQVASGVSVQDPALADYLRANGAAHEKAAKDAAPGEVKLLTELAVNPLSTKEERDAAAKGEPFPAPETPGKDTGGVSAQSPDKKK
jgi:hypothetical protein